MDPRFTIIVPTHNHGELLRFSIGCILRQSVEDWELFIIGDGVDGVTRAVALDLAARDARITFVDKPKHPRRGETYRHELLTSVARGKFVTYCTDDDLWLPDHLNYMGELLATSDWAHPLSCFVDAQEKIQVRPVDLQNPYYPKLMLGKENRIGLSFMAHTMDFYRHLPYGWRTTPEGRWTDHYMYQQFLSVRGAKVIGGNRATVLSFPDGVRTHYTTTQKLEELKRWFQKIQEPKFDEWLTGQLLDAACAKTVELESDLMPKLLDVIKSRDQFQKDVQTLQELANRQQNDISVLQKALEEERSRSRSWLSAIRERLFSNR